MPFAATWVDLEIIILSEVSQIKTNIIWDYWYVKSNKEWYRVPTVVQWNQQHLCSARMQVQSPAQNSGLKDLVLLQLQYRLQLWFGSDTRPRNSICCGVAKKGGKKIMIQRNLLTKQNKTQRFQNQTYSYQRDNTGGRDKMGGWNWHLHTIMRGMDE